jgi:hypothetical protein
MTKHPNSSQPAAKDLSREEPAAMDAKLAGYPWLLARGSGRRVDSGPHDLDPRLTQSIDAHNGTVQPAAPTSRANFAHPCSATAEHTAPGPPHPVVILGWHSS